MGNLSGHLSTFRPTLGPKSILFPTCTHTPQGSQGKLLRLLAREGGKKKKERKPHILGHGPQNGFVA